MHFSAAFIPFLATAVTAWGWSRPEYGGEGTVTVSEVKITKVAIPVGFTIPNFSFKLSGIGVKNLDCSATNLPWPEVAFASCDNRKWSFALLPRDDSSEIHLMVYHDVGDKRADLRGGIILNLECQGEGDEKTCKQRSPVTFEIDGPVADYRGRHGSDELK